ncbi:hypothetical protein [uncultured Paraglaciecola sp.]|uniref:hypothetical protein n=1 Tax=uncultured Paraglaciecola sp. TaxID=1765024 RepID=UPI0026253042|nr:hypothetical protein [uncultured Paraglaciecola sp.]
MSKIPADKRNELHYVHVSSSDVLRRDDESLCRIQTNREGVDPDASVQGRSSQWTRSVANCF